MKSKTFRVAQGELLALVYRRPPRAFCFTTPSEMAVLCVGNPFLPYLCVVARPLRSEARL